MSHVCGASIKVRLVRQSNCSQTRLGLACHHRSGRLDAERARLDMNTVYLPCGHIADTVTAPSLQRRHTLPPHLDERSSHARSQHNTCSLTHARKPTNTSLAQLACAAQSSKRPAPSLRMIRSLGTVAGKADKLRMICPAVWR